MSKCEQISKFDSFLPEFDETYIINLDTKPFASGKFGSIYLAKNLGSIYLAKISFMGTSL